MSHPLDTTQGPQQLTCQFGWLESALALSILSLIAQLCWPAFEDWHKRPTAGSFGIVRVNVSNDLQSLSDQIVVRLPLHYGEPDRRWPLVVFLHGSRQRGADIQQLLEYLQKGPFQFIVEGEDDLPAILVAPQCAADLRWEPDAVAGIAREFASQFPIDSSRIYLIGCSMGGYGVWETAAAHPDLFAAAVPICGGGNPESADALVQLPIWAFHGAKDEVIPISNSQQMIDAIRQVGGVPKFTVLENEGHGICNPVCGRADMWEWLLTKRELH